ncbi:glycerol-3-phosphate acyltransferase [Cytobacillus suaedae]|nr:glycerol-3-phosphate acyltransferase [Cytobacillus suaedae]
MAFIAYLLTSYLVGCIMFGYIVTKLSGKGDIRCKGSGNVGSRNVGRVVGKSAFVATFLGDAGKAIVVIMLGQYLGLPLIVQLIGFLFVIIGHLWPITLAFHGGKGIASFLGGIIYLEPMMACVLVGVFVVMYLIFKGFNRPGLIAIGSTPIALLFLDYEFVEWVIVFVIALLAIYADRFERKR